MMMKILKIIPLILIILSSVAHAANKECPLGDSPKPVVLKPNMPVLIGSLEKLKDTNGKVLWKKTPESLVALTEIFESVPQKTKLEQFYQLLFVLQNEIDLQSGKVAVRPPGITDVLIAAKVFTTPDFPKHIKEVSLSMKSSKKIPTWSVFFDEEEVRFPINGGRGFDSWDQGMCQTARELVFYPGFSFNVRKAGGNKNLIADDFEGVEIFGTFGSRAPFKIDIEYVDLERVEFIRGTDQGKVKARVAKREFAENPHSGLFKFIGGLIPNTSKQRIDW